MTYILKWGSEGKNVPFFTGLQGKIKVNQTHVRRGLV